MELSSVLEPWTVILAILICLVTAWIISRLTRKSLHLPPGPASWPILGNIPSIVRSKLSPQDLLSKWAVEYGDIFRIRIITTDVIVLNSYKLIREAFQHSDILDRPTVTAFEDVVGRKNVGVASSSGSVWKEQRQFMHSVFRSFGVGKQSFEDVISVEAKVLCDEISQLQGKALNPHKLLNNAVSNVICTVIFGRRHNYTDPDFNRLLEIVNNNLESASSGGAFIFIPILAKLPFRSVLNIKSGIQDFTVLVQKIIADHRKTFDPEQPRDMMDMYLAKIQEKMKMGESSTFDEINLVVCTGDLFAAGSETTTTFLKWALLYMMDKPDIQVKVQSELDSVVGRNRLPRLSDLSDLPFTEATIFEVQRLAMVTPFGLPHSCRADTRLAGYDVPAGTLVLPNLWRLARDERVWEQPDEFKPERFLNKDGKCVKPDELIPFSTGKRVCLGESLAKKEMFIFFTSLLQRFTFKVPPNASPYSMTGVLGITYNTKMYETCACERD